MNKVNGTKPRVNETTVDHLEVLTRILISMMRNLLLQSNVNERLITQFAHDVSGFKIRWERIYRNYVPTWLDVGVRRGVKLKF